LKNRGVGARRAAGAPRATTGAAGGENFAKKNPKKEDFPYKNFTKFRSKKHEDNTKIMTPKISRFQSSD